MNVHSRLHGEDGAKMAERVGAQRGDTDDAASMNVWLHTQVMNQLAENGGELPDDV